ncbi:MAG: type II toxin-antitoxin system VapC family toxin [Proteobacteria bacterium]|nr:type II toxin-antitoxin system VapC family toxin [Pseudomonadota bacterium]
MRFLLDTQVFLWWIADDPRLSEKARGIMRNVENRLFLSAASGWEIAIKAKLGRIRLPQNPQGFVARQLSANAIESFPIQMGHALHTFTLPPYHRDPFDRIIVAQAQLEKLTVLSSDPQIARYDIKVIG